MYEPSILLETLINGILLGGIYILMAVGFNLVYGVMKILNIAHGEFIMISAYITYWMYTLFDFNPIAFLPFSALIFFAIGFILYKGPFGYVVRRSRTRSEKEGSSMLLSFGIILLTSNVARQVWSPTPRGIFYLTTTIKVFGLAISLNSLVSSLIAIALTIGLYIMLKKTYMGKAIRALAQNKEAAQLMGVNTERLNSISFSIGTATAGVAGALVSLL